MRNKYVVRVDPQGQTMVVDVLDMAGVSVPAYESPQFAATARALPLTITTQTDFCLAAPGAYDVSCKVGGSEVADAGAPKRVRLTDVPVLVTPDWERQRTAASAASSAPAAPPSRTVRLRWDLVADKVNLVDVYDETGTQLLEVATALTIDDGVDLASVGVDWLQIGSSFRFFVDINTRIDGAIHAVAGAADGYAVVSVASGRGGGGSVRAVTGTGGQDQSFTLFGLPAALASGGWNSEPNLTSLDYDFNDANLTELVFYLFGPGPT